MIGTLRAPPTAADHPPTPLLYPRPPLPQPVRMSLGGNPPGGPQPTISPRLLRPMCGMAQSSLRIALPKKPSGSAGRFWPNHRIHVLKAKALLFSSDYGRGFGSVFHHQFQKPELVSGFFTSARRTSSGGPSRICLASGAPHISALLALPGLSALGFYLVVSRACARLLPVLVRVSGR